MRPPSPPPSPLLKAISMLLSCAPSAAFARPHVVRGMGAAHGRGIAQLPLKAVVSRAGSAASMSTSGYQKGRRERCSDLPLFYNDVYRVELPGGHRFPMEKYRLVREVRRTLRPAAIELCVLMLASWMY